MRVMKIEDVAFRLAIGIANVVKWALIAGLIAVRRNEQRRRGGVLEDAGKACVGWADYSWDRHGSAAVVDSVVRGG